MSLDLIAVFGTIALVQFLGWMTPGPNLVAIASASMAQGRQNGLATAFGIATGIIFWAGLSVAGIALIFEYFPLLFTAIRLCGAAYLLWLGYKSLQAALAGGKSHLKFGDAPRELRAAFFTGILVIITNPKAPIFFGSILTAFLPVGAPTWILVAIVAEFFVLSVILNSFTAIVFSTNTMVVAFARFERVVNAAFGLLFIGLGLWVAIEVFVN